MLRFVIFLTVVGGFLNCALSKRFTPCELATELAKPQYNISLSAIPKIVCHAVSADLSDNLNSARHYRTTYGIFGLAFFRNCDCDITTFRAPCERFLDDYIEDDIFCAIHQGVFDVWIGSYAPNPECHMTWEGFVEEHRCNESANYRGSEVPSSTQVLPPENTEAPVGYPTPELGYGTLSIQADQNFNSQGPIINQESEEPPSSLALPMETTPESMGSLILFEHISNPRESTTKQESEEASRQAFSTEASQVAMGYQTPEFDDGAFFSDHNFNLQGPITNQRADDSFSSPENFPEGYDRFYDLFGGFEEPTSTPSSDSIRDFGLGPRQRISLGRPSLQFHQSAVGSDIDQTTYKSEDVLSGLFSAESESSPTLQRWIPYPEVDYSEQIIMEENLDPPLQNVLDYFNDAYMFAESNSKYIFAVIVILIFSCVVLRKILRNKKMQNMKNYPDNFASNI